MAIDVADWLRGLGLEQYAPAFRDNAIDAEVLPSLTADDLKDLGVALVGHRRRLLDAIAALKSEANSTADPDASATPTSTLASAAAARSNDAERRQLTIMFCDLVGSTALAARLDPEDLRELIGAYHAAVAEEVGRFGGFVAKYMGDGVLIYFGYPQAHEDDAERAIHAGLALAERVGRLDTTVRLETRIGIATGLVVVGDLIGAGEAQERGVVGETPNLAARLQAMAPAGGVLIAEGTRQLVGDLFDVSDLGAVEVRGFDGPVPVWQVLRPSAVESRFEALHAAALTPLVGREEELDLLLRRWRRAQAGEGQVVLLSGEPGIGKSRLTAALQERLRGEPHIQLRYFCSPYHRDSTLHPFISQLERAASFAREDVPAAKLDKLATLLGRSGDESAETIALVADLLSLPSNGRYPPLPADPQRKREMTLAALLNQLEGFAAQRPVLMMFEDAHWADSTSLELLDRAIERLARLPVLAVITFRPEFQAPWIGQAHVSSLSLNRLAQRETASLVNSVTGGKSLPPEILDRIVERTDGIPLFIEELTKTLLEGRLLREEGDGYVLAGPLPPLAIPSSLHASLMARLDRLAPVKEVAQIGAAIGREFSYELVVAVARRSEAQLNDALDQLVAARLLFRRGMPPRASFTFKHALVQEAAYTTLLRSQRQELHGRIARVLEERFPETAVAEPEILAQHFENAGILSDAIDYWVTAGNFARRRSANAEAAAHFRRGLKLVFCLGDAAGRDRKEFKLQYSLGQVLMATEGYASAGAETAYRRASELCTHVDENEDVMRVLLGLRSVSQVQGNSVAARQYGTRCLEIALHQGNHAFASEAHASLGHTLCFMGNFMEARSHLADALTCYDPDEHRSRLAAGGLDPLVFGLGIMGWNEWLLGYPDRASKAAAEGLRAARTRNHPQSLDQALCSAAVTHLSRREPEIALGLLDEALAISEQQGFRFRIVQARLLRSWALLAVEEAWETLSELSIRAADYRATGGGDHGLLAAFLAALVERYRRSGQIVEGLAIIEQAKKGVWWQAELHRLEGDLLQAAGEHARIEQCYRESLAIAREQQAKSWELRAATSLARLWRDQGRRAEARELLAPVYGWFTEGFDTADLLEAKALLASLD